MLAYDSFSLVLGRYDNAVNAVGFNLGETGTHAVHNGHVETSGAAYDDHHNASFPYFLEFLSSLKNKLQGDPCPLGA